MTPDSRIRELKPLQFNRREVRPTLLGRADQVLGGLEGNNIPDDFSIPPCGLRDVDLALFNFFDKSLNLQVSTQNITKNVPVVFAGGDRYALVKSGRPIRDKGGAIVTPIIAIHRTGIMQGTDPNMAFGVDTGDIVIKRRLDRSDRTYQKLVNRFGLRNQDNVASPGAAEDLIPPVSSARPGRVATRRRTGAFPLQSALDNPLGNNVFEIITVPTPNFITLRYTVTFWTNYQSEMNQLIERVLAGHDVGSLYNARIESEKGYWFVAYFENDWAMNDNFTDYTTQKKLIKSTLNVKVPAYTLGSEGPGDPLPLRRFTSAPSFDFEVCETDAIVEQVAVQMPMLGPENPAFIRENVEFVGVDGRQPEFDIRESIASREFLFNPFATTQAGGDPRFSRVVCRTSKGERVGRITDALILERIAKT